TAMECFKNCCKNFMRKKEKEQEIQGTVGSCTSAVSNTRGPDDGRSGVSEDYLLSKLPPDGREVPFVLPTFKPSYIQPRGSRYPNLHPAVDPTGSARTTYAERKAELLGTSHIVYNPESSFHQSQMAEYFSPGSARRDTLKNRNSSPQGPGRKQHQVTLSRAPFMIHNAQLRCELIPTESITLSGDERELGKVCVRLSYQEALEQVWITLVQCSDLNLPPDSGEPQKIGFKGIITMPKPIEFKSSIKECGQDAVFMETFVFALRLQQLRCSALVLRLQTHNPRKRTVAQCVVSLRQLGPQETEHWLDLSPPSKSSACHSELHVATCFQPVNGRIQLQVLAAQNLPASSSPLTQAFFVKAEMHQVGRVVMKKKTRALKASGGQCQWTETFHFHLAALDHACTLSIKLCARSSVRRKQVLGQVHLGFDSPVPEAVEQWNDTMAHPEKVVAAWHRLSPS
uniref:Tandem C2 domains, nuclear n=1 Tax=Myripristis murdjan TaxID=586833 RepID=A0A667YTT5_9TELE